MISTVYEVEHAPSGKTYVGMTSRGLEARWKQHVSSSRTRPRGRLGRLLASEGPKEFSLKVRATLPTPQEAGIVERLILATEKHSLNSLTGPQCSTTLGKGGWTLSAEACAKIGKAHRGKKVSEETRKRISEGHKKNPKVVAHCRQLAESMKGTKLSPEHVAKMSAARTGRKHSDETKQKMAAARKAWWAARKAFIAGGN